MGSDPVVVLPLIFDDDTGFPQIQQELMVQVYAVRSKPSHLFGHS